MEDGTASRCDGVDVHHWGTDPDACYFSFIGAFEFPGVMTDIGGGSSHIEANQLVEARFVRGAYHPNYPTRGTGQQCVFTLERVGVCESSI